MKKLSWIPLCLSILGSLLLTLAPNHAQEKIQITLDGLNQIFVGEAWSLDVVVEGLSQDEVLQATMLHGMSLYSEELQTGTGGIARWHFDAGILTQAGVSQVIIRAGEEMSYFALEVLTNEPETLESFTTGNSLSAYGDAETSLVTLVMDNFGNPVDDVTLTIRQTSPSGDTRSGIVSSHHGLASKTIRSMGNPGILRLLVSYGASVETALNIVQLAGVANDITLTLSSTCVLADGLDNITLTTQLLDNHGFPVTDGQVVFFTWDTGGATGITVDGMASLTIPPPPTTGSYHYRATSGSTFMEQTLIVAQGQCDD